MDANYHSSSPQRPKPLRVKAPTDGPPQLSPIDKIIELHHGSSTAIEATPERLQASKQYPIPSLTERIEQLQRQLTSLNHEIAYYRQIEPYRREFEDSVERLGGGFEKAVFKLGKIQRHIGHEWAQLKSGSRPNVQKDF
jgi:TolA-binding protein